MGTETHGGWTKYIDMHLKHEVQRKKYKPISATTFEAQFFGYKYI